MSIYEQAGGEDRMAGGWRAIGSAWLLVLLVVALFVGFSALATHCAAWYNATPASERVIVPHHDPVCDAAGPACAPAPGIDAQGIISAYAPMM